MPSPASPEDAPMLTSAADADPASSRWARVWEKLTAPFSGADPRVCIAFWLFGLVNNVLYVIILSAAQDLVGGDVPKGVILVAAIIPAFATKLTAPYFIYLVPYAVRIVIFVFLSTIGMLVVALSPSSTDSSSIASKISGIILASFSAGGGELSFMALTHFYGPFSLASWSSGTGAAGLVGAGVYALATSLMGFSVRTTLLASACLPLAMAFGFFVVLPRGVLQAESAQDGCTAVERGELLAEDGLDGEDADTESDGLLGVAVHSTDSHKDIRVNEASSWWEHVQTSLKRMRKLFLPFMVPLLIVFIAEYVINQGVYPTLLFPLRDSPFSHFRSFYPAYNAVYQIGAWVSRSSTPFLRIHNVYIPALLQVVNLLLFTLQALFSFIPNVWLVFFIIFWEGLLGGIVYVNTFAEIGERVPLEVREFSLGATTVSDSAGICIAGFLSMGWEVWLCDWQIAHGRDWCRKL
ncbi:uncharacterized protein PFLUO_LOCUS4085 [Penicillium psychrofluorescens]|uniref:uncharacterized protein n=1 Tax=Penicillium psychrofluorescens TaxID=3158075 RepID=UPI003CCD240E